MNVQKRHVNKQRIVAETVDTLMFGMAPSVDSDVSLEAMTIR